MARTVTRKASRNISLAVLLSLAVHAGIGVVIWGMKPDSLPNVPSQNVVMVDMVPLETPLPEEIQEPAMAGPQAETPTPSQSAQTEEAAKAPAVVPKPQTAPPPPVHRTPPPVLPTEVVQVSSAPPALDLRLLGEGELAGALVAGAGAGGGAGEGGSGGGGEGGSGSGASGRCDMAGRLQALVRRDSRIQSEVRRVQAALSAGRRAMQIWDGDWVQSQGQEGRGLAGVRQAIAVEVAFAPRECRQQRVNGLVVLSLGDDAGAPRLALGTASWQWGELALR